MVTGARAEYGLLRWLMQGIKCDAEMELQVVATGMHLSPEFGLTYEEILNDGFQIDRKVEMLMSSDTSVGIAKSIGLGFIGFADALNELNPDLLVVLGDRFEVFAAVSVAYVVGIPVAHFHGGEVTQGAIDDAFRHSITKMSSLHFVAAESYRRRVVQLGEAPENVFLVGGLGVDGITRLKLLDRDSLESELNLKFGNKNLLITFHPETLAKISPERQMEELLAALSLLTDTELIFTLPNADTNGRILIELIKKFISDRPNAHLFPSLGQERYLSCISHVDGVIGNSSSGLLEAPSLNRGSINIGDRQRGRLQAQSVINCEPNRESIASAIATLYSSKFQESLKNISNPYGEGGASEKAVAILKNHSLNFGVGKLFYDLSTSHDGE